MNTQSSSTTGLFPSAPPPNYTSVPTATDEELARAGLSADAKPTVFECDASIRNAFIAKVYAILSLQLLVTASASLVMALVPSVRAYVQSSPGILIAAIVLSFVTLFGLMWQRHAVPYNFMWLGAFTVCEAWLVGAVVTTYSADVVLQALLLTCGLFGVLTVAAGVAARRGTDLSRLGTVLTVMLAILVLVGLIGLFLPFASALHTFYCIAGAIIFCGLILFDTWRIMTQLSPDEYVAAALDLYLDLLNLFLYLLELLGQRND
ncbi:hypothetical protein H9P43_004969 [Blastocladiella emersonii ATCC 22665]|nr:hypothetical protein H9P43_004969 [Blastocladiella emersonii ATCC 22665]